MNFFKYQNSPGGELRIGSYSIILDKLVFKNQTNKIFLSSGIKLFGWRLWIRRPLSVKDVLLPVLRTKNLSNISGEMFVEWPLQKITDLEETHFCEMQITGGPRYECYNGLVPAEWQLAIVTGVRTHGEVGITFVHKTRVVDRFFDNTNDLPLHIRADWEKRIEVYQNESLSITNDA